MRILASLAALVAVAFVAVAWYMTQTPNSADPFAPCRSSRIAGGSEAIGGPFELIDAAGRTVTDKDIITEPSLVYFGYTFCPDVCPLDTARNAEVVDLLSQRGISVTPVFISVDPKRDTPEVVGEFARNLHEKMIGLTGSAEQIRAASAAYRVYYKAHESEDPYYVVDHSTFSYLVLPGRGFVEFFRRETPPDAMADTVACFIENTPE